MLPASLMARLNFFDVVRTSASGAQHRVIMSPRSCLHLAAAMGVGQIRHPDRIGTAIWAAPRSRSPRP
jgi:hypothetical protein